MTGFVITLSNDQEARLRSGESLMIGSESSEAKLGMININDDTVDDRALQQRIEEVVLSLNALGTMFSNTAPVSLCENPDFGLGMGTILFNLAEKISLE